MPSSRGGVGDELAIEGVGDPALQAADGLQWSFAVGALAPVVGLAFENDTTSIDHNIYTQGRYAYASNYTSGLRVYDTRALANGGLSEVAFFDLYPENDNTTFEGGTWSNYAYFGQKGIVAASSIDRGLFILQPRLGRQGN